MRRTSFFASILLLLIILSPMTAQDTLSLPEILVSANYESWTSGWDTLYDKNQTSSQFHRSVGRLMAKNTTVPIRQIGPGGLATALVQGSGAQHLGIVWQGIRLESGTTGIFDLSLLPVSVFDLVQYNRSGKSFQFGEGSIGGLITVQNQPGLTQARKSSLGYTTADIGQSVTFARHQSTYGNTSVHLRASFEDSQNRYKYTNTALREPVVEKQNHARTRIINILPSIRHDLSSRAFFEAHMWYQHADRNIPAAIFQSDPKATQIDEALRLSGKYVHQWQDHTLRIGMGMTNSRLDYESNVVSLSSTDVTQYNPTIIWDLVKVKAGIDNRIQLGHLHQKAVSNQFESVAHRDISSAYHALRMKRSNWDIRFNQRLEWVDRSLSPWTGSVEVGYHWEKVETKARIERNHRLPTFNDLYWPISGNTELKDETSFGQNVEMNVRWTLHAISLKSQLNASHSVIDEWIQWVPQSQVLWRPFNVKKVRLAVISIRQEAEWKWGQLKMRGHLTSTYTSARNAETDHPSISASTDKQLIYVPEWSTLSTLEGQLKYWTLFFNYRTVSKRFFTTDESDHLPPFGVLDVQLSRKIPLNSTWQGHIAFSIDNVLNGDYSMVRGYPMPLRNYQLHLLLDITHK